MVTWQKTGHSGLDELIFGLRTHDQVVWQIEVLSDYQMLCQKLAARAIAEQKHVTYVHFKNLTSLFTPDQRTNALTIHEIDTSEGFEQSARAICSLIERNGSASIMIFDNLSEQLIDWGADLMIENFLRIVSPLLAERQIITYFALQLGRHSCDTVAEISEITQLLINLYHWDTHVTVHVQHASNRYHHQLFWPHRLHGETCVPLSIDELAGRFMEIIRKKENDLNPEGNLWHDYLDKRDPIFTAQMQKRLLTSEQRMGHLVKTYFNYNDLININNRMIGSGKIGGKAVGMLLARNILQSESLKDEDFTSTLEPHDSYYIGTDIFYSYIVENNGWSIWMAQKEENGYYSEAEKLRDILLRGTFSERMHDAFRQLVNVFGQSPIIVRSSSLLEDDFGNAFAGKYESVFCANQGTPEERLEAFEQAVRIVYASTMSQDALKYRINRNLDKKDEQMAILVQRVSGQRQGHFFYPLMAGVAHSENLYVWNDKLDVSAGMLRLVFGLGTRAVDRVEGDYPRLVALDQPLLSSHASKEDENTYSQRFVDLIDLESNELVTLPLEAMLREDPSIDLTQVGEIDWVETQRLRELGYHDNPKWVLNFNKFLSNDTMMNTIRDMTKHLEAAYEYPVDLEFTINLTDKRDYQINLLQCRPLQTKSIGSRVDIPQTIDIRDTMIETNGHFMGGNVRLNVKYIVYVNPESYSKLPDQDKYQIARLIGLLNHKLFDVDDAPTLLLGPGRWGTTTPSLGVPVQYSEIDNIAALGEVSFEVSGMMPELSFGSHFFQDLVEGGIFYMAVLPHIKDYILNLSIFEDKKNIFTKILPEHYRWADIISIYDFSPDNLTIFSDITTQRLLCVRLNT